MLATATRAVRRSARQIVSWRARSARHADACRTQRAAECSRSLATTAEPRDIDVDGVAYAFMGSQALFAALDLGVFDAVAACAPAPLEAIQAEVGIEAPRLQTLVTALTALGALRRDATGMYALSPNAARFLVREAPHFYGDYLRLQVGAQFYPRMGGLAGIVRGEAAPSYASWFSDPVEAERYSLAQHNGSAATARQLVKLARRGDLGPELEATVAGPGARLLDVGGGSGAFAYVLAEECGATATVLELPAVAEVGRSFAGGPDVDVEAAARVRFEDLDVTAPAWPVEPASFDIVLMSYVSGSVPETALGEIYGRARAALAPGGLLVVHDFMVEDSLDGPPHAALWALQHVTVNADGLGLHPSAVAARLRAAGFARVDAPKDMIRGMTKLLVAHAEPGTS